MCLVYMYVFGEDLFFVNEYFRCVIIWNLMDGCESGIVNIKFYMFILVISG